MWPFTIAAAAKLPILDYLLTLAISFAQALKYGFGREPSR